jgi:hypothetical protein
MDEAFEKRKIWCSEQKSIGEKMATFYRQCTLKRDTEGDVRWIPEQFAVMDKYLRIKKSGTEEDGWQVVRVGENRVDRIHIGA